MQKNKRFFFFSFCALLLCVLLGITACTLDAETVKVIQTNPKSFLFTEKGDPGYVIVTEDSSAEKARLFLSSGSLLLENISYAEGPSPMENGVEGLLDVTTYEVSAISLPDKEPDLDVRLDLLKIMKQRYPVFALFLHTRTMVLNGHDLILWDAWPGQGDFKVNTFYYDLQTGEFGIQDDWDAKKEQKELDWEKDMDTLSRFLPLSSWGEDTDEPEQKPDQNFLDLFRRDGGILGIQIRGDNPVLETAGFRAAFPGLAGKQLEPEHIVTLYLTGFPSSSEVLSLLQEKEEEAKTKEAVTVVEYLPSSATSEEDLWLAKEFLINHYGFHETQLYDIDLARLMEDYDMWDTSKWNKNSISQILATEKENYPIAR